MSCGKLAVIIVHVLLILNNTVHVCAYLINERQILFGCIFIRCNLILIAQFDRLRINSLLLPLAVPIRTIRSDINQNGDHNKEQNAPQAGE